MKIIEGLVQGSDAWLAHRRTTRNASDAPAVMGASPYMSRSELIKQKATGVEREINERTQAIFDRGHAVEPALRAMAERILGEDLFPVTSVSDDDYLGASFDGVSMLGEVIFEAKQTNADKMARMARGEIPPVDYWQIVQQFDVCETAQRCLYMVGDGTEDNTAQMEISRADVEHDIPKLRAGWEQLDKDVLLFVPEVKKFEATGRAPETLPALRIEVTGMVTASNLAEWKAKAIEVFQNISTELTTDQEFADAERTVKWCGEIEDQLKAAKQHALSQTASIDELFRTVDAISAEARAKRLELEKLVKVRKEAVREQIVQAGRTALQAHYDSINATLHAHAIPFPASIVVADLGQAIKGKKSLASMQDAVSSTVANAKIAASQQADRVRANVAILAEHPDHASLFADRVQLCASKAPDDLRNLVAARIAEHQQREAARLEQERERIRREEVARLEREQRQRDEDKRRAELAEEDRIRRELEQAEQTVPAPAADLGNVAPQVADAPTGAGAASAGTVRSAGTGGAARIKLSDINAAIAPLSITGDGLAQLGFLPVATERAAKLYDATQFMDMCSALIERLHNAGVDSYRKAA